MNKPKILFLYDYFDPAYKAGGPIRSLVNLVHLLENHYNIYILTTHQDHDGSVLDVTPDIWTSYGTCSQVKYLSTAYRGYRSIKKEILEVDPKVVYLNGMYSLSFVVYPLAVLRNQHKIKTVVAPRGMLQTQARAIKPWKKKMYLSVLKSLFIHKNIIWHCTTPQEKTELSDYALDSDKIKLIGNVPNFQKTLRIPERTKSDPPVFGTVALISPMKNILSILKALSTIKTEMVYRLFGPIKDHGYWLECQEYIAKMPPNIRVEYQGEISPHKVGGEIADFDFYIQPSKSENFGHSIFEAFNQGIPVIISDQTPWKRLYEKQAGWDVDLNSPIALASAVEQALEMDDTTYLQFRKGARAIAEQYMGENDFIKDYRELFR